MTRSPFLTLSLFSRQSAKARAAAKRRRQYTERSRRSLAFQPLEERSLMSVAPSSIITGAGPGGGPHVRAFHGADLTDQGGLFAYDQRFAGGVSVAAGDVNGDGTADIITGAGPGGGPHVRIFSGTNLAELAGFFAYDQAFTGGVSVAAGDVNGDGRADIITGAGPGGGPHVRVFSGLDLSELPGFFAYDQAFRGGVSVAAGDVNGDGRVDIITGAGPGGGPHVRVFSGLDRAELPGFYAYDPLFAGGVKVAAGDVNGDGRSDIITGPGPGGGPHIRVLSGLNRAELLGFFAYDSRFTGGVAVGSGDLNGDGRADVITGAGPGGGPHVRAFSGVNRTELASFFAYAPNFTGGVHVAGTSLRGDTDPPEISAALANDTGESATDRLTFDATIIGNVSDDRGVTAFRAGFDATTAANFVDVLADRRSDGTFVFSQARLNEINGAALAEGAHVLHLQARDLAGNLSAVLDVPFTLDTTAPTTPTFDLLAADDSGVIGDQRTDEDVVTLFGMTDASLRVAALQTGNTTTAMGNGGIRMDNVALRLGDNPLTLRATDAAGNHSTFSRTIVRVAAAETLNDRALAAYESVLNTVEFVPYRGAHKGAQATAETLAGNAWDQAALLVQRLTDADVNARYVSGRVSAPDDLVMQWLGVIDSLAAESVLDAAGLSADFDGSTNRLAFEHIWVEAEVVAPFVNGLSWVPLDPTWKFKDRQAGIQGLLREVPFDEAGYLSQARNESALEYYEQQVAAWLRANHPDLSLADVPYDGPIIQQHFDAVPTHLPYSTVSASDPFTEIPATMTQRARLTLSDGDTQIWTQTFVMPEMGFDRLTIAFLSATNTIPVIYQNGIAIAAGGDANYGQAMDLRFESLEPGDDIVDVREDILISARGYYALGLDVHQHSTISLDRMQDVVNLAGFKFNNQEQHPLEARISGVLALAVGKYFYEDQRADDAIHGLAGYTDGYRGMGFGFAQGENLSYHEDLPIQLIPGRASISVHRHSTTIATPIDVDVGTLDAIRQLRGVNGSALEHILWEDLINSPSLSTIRSFQLANERGIPILTIDSGNKAALFPQLTLEQFDLDFLSEQIDAGGTITVPRDPTPLHDFRGVGYRVTGGTFNGYLIRGELFPEEEQSMVLHGGIATGQVQPAPDVEPGTPHPSQFHVSDPVNIANGNVAHDQIDISLPGVGFNLEFARHYDSQATVNMGLGVGWSSSFGEFLSFAGENGPITWHTRQGYRYTFLPITDEEGFVTPSALHGELTALAGGFRYRDKNGDTHTFDATGRLTEHRDRNGNGQLLTYDNGTGRLAMVSDANDARRHLTFTYTGGLITRVTDFTGRNWFYSYTDGRLSQVAGPSLVAGRYLINYEYFTDNARNGLLKTITHGDGGVISFEYYPNRRAFRQIDPDGGATTLHYNLLGRQTTVIDPRGNTEIHQYNLDGNRIGVTRADRTREEFTWANNLLLAEMDAFGKTKTYSYDTAGNLTDILDRDGTSTSFVYEPLFNKLISATGSGGRVTTFSYDANGNLTEILDSLGGRTTFTYDARGQVLTQTEPQGNETPAPGDHTATFTYNTAGLVASRATDLPSLETFSYDSRGNPSAITDANGNTTTLLYDQRNRLVRITDADGASSLFAYDVMSNLTVRTDPLGRQTLFAYDRAQNPVRRTNPDLSVAATTYDLADNVLSQTNELGHTTRFQHDERNRQVALYLPDGTSTRADHDAAHRVVRIQDALGNTTRLAYDPVGRLITAIDAANGISSRSYDAVGNLLSLTDPLGHGAQFTYDLLDRQIAATDAVGGTTLFAYDRNSRLASLTDPAGNVTTYAYDVRDLLIRETDPLGNARLFAYDPVGNLTRSTDRNGRVRTFAYDTLNRQTSERWLDVANNVIRTINSTYDTAGQLTSIVDPDSTLGIAYNGRGDVARVSKAGTPNVPAVELRYAYDAGRNLISVTDTIGGLPGALTAYVYDEMDQMVRILQSGAEVRDKRVNLSYNHVGQFDEIHRTGSFGSTQFAGTTTFEYDALNRLTRLKHDRFDVEQAFETLTYDAASRITSLLNVDGISTYAYDGRHQLLSADHTLEANADESYTYDASGNRIASSRHGGGYETGPGNRLLSDGAFNYQYDAEGNLTRRTPITTGVIREFQWDHRNRLVAVIDKHPVGAELKRVTYVYDAFDRRIEKTVDSSPLDAIPGVVTSFVYDRANVLLEFVDNDDAGSAAPQQSTRYLHGPAVDQVLAQEDDEGDVLWLLADHLGTTRDLVDSAGEVQNHLSYDSFGNLASQTDPDYATRYLFTGREFDAETNLYYYRARYYDAALGRFLSEDPIRLLAGDTNFYRYVDNGPLGATDPTGLWTVEVGLNFDAVAGLILPVADSQNHNVSVALAAPDFVPRDLDQLKLFIDRFDFGFTKTKVEPSVVAGFSLGLGAQVAFTTATKLKSLEGTSYGYNADVGTGFVGFFSGLGVLVGYHKELKDPFMGFSLSGGFTPINSILVATFGALNTTAFWTDEGPGPDGPTSRGRETYGRNF